jgi:hypothetical protein
MTALALAGLVVATACARDPGGQAGVATAPPDSVPSPAPRGQPPANPITGHTLPPLDRNNAVVDLADIHFDTFNGGSVPLADADAALIERLRDAIAPIYFPAYEDAATASEWLADDDLVIGLAAANEAYAYPHRVLNFHEIVHEQVDGVPLLVSYCPLCQSSVVYDRRLDDRVLTFGNTSALYDSDLVMFDWETHTYWWQVPGRGIVGELAGESLTLVPSQTMTWAQWRALHPETSVLARPEPSRINYDRDPFSSLPEFLDSGGEPFPISDAANDGRLPPSALVLGVEIAGQQRVYPVELLAGRIVQEDVGGKPVVVIGSDAGDAASAYLAGTEEQPLTFTLQDGNVTDNETGSTWDNGGRATAGPLAGTQLSSAPSRTTFWFAYVASHPEFDLWVTDS